MACFKPLAAHYTWRGEVAVTRAVGQTGLEQGEFAVPCGRCIGCRIDQSKQAAVRCVHEERMQAEAGRQSTFLTLTYEDHNVPDCFVNKKTGEYYGNGTLDPNDHVDFVNKLRLRLYRKGQSFRYYMCGEYGEKFLRPHFHYLIFGYGFPDKEPWRIHKGVQYYRSEELESIWNYGHSSIGHVTVESAAYCARYVKKKINGQLADAHYRNAANERILPEFTRMSLKPGIGASWFEKYGVTDVYDSGDFIVINGVKYSTPRYYDKLYERLDADALASIKSQREERARAFQFDNTYERLQTKEEAQRLRLKRLHRGYESGETQW